MAVFLSKTGKKRGKTAKNGLKDLERGPRAVLPCSRFSNIPRFRFDSRLKPVFASFFPVFHPVLHPFSTRSRPVLVLLTHQIEIFSTWFIAIGPRRTITRSWSVCKVLFCGSKPSALGFCAVFLFGGKQSGKLNNKRSDNTTSMGRQRMRARQGGQEEDAVGRKKRRLEGG